MIVPHMFFNWSTILLLSRKYTAHASIENQITSKIDIATHDCTLNNCSTCDCTIADFVPNNSTFCEAVDSLVDVPTLVTRVVTSVGVAVNRTRGRRSQRIPDEQMLYTDLLTYYDPSVRPVKNATITVVINFSLTLHQIVDLVSSEGNYS